MGKPRGLGTAHGAVVFVQGQAATWCESAGVKRDTHTLYDRRHSAPLADTGLALDTFPGRRVPTPGNGDAIKAHGCASRLAGFYFAVAEGWQRLNSQSADDDTHGIVCR